ncbi:MAG: hypothetical protein M0R74_13480 [Dehalococcoidia bacterium]|jgi:hypothetical protein|nr:hypothetical protein [Dehalococcoidia bacterium]
MKIGEKTIAMIRDQVEGLLRENLNQINRAYLHAEDAFKISFPVEIKPNGNGFKVKTEIGYTVEKVKSAATATVVEGPSLFMSENKKPVVLTEWLLRAGEHPADRRSRLHVLWMVRRPAADFLTWIKGDPLDLRAKWHTEWMIQGSPGDFEQWAMERP